ncbi:MAG: PaaI family thioesterase [Chloroflexota bacterium]
MALEGERLTAAFTAQPEHQGWDGIVHGGVISALLYEVMANLPRFLAQQAALRNCDVRYRRPTPVGEPLNVAADVAERGMRRWKLRAEITDSAGARLATAEGEAALLSPERAAELGFA